MHPTCNGSHTVESEQFTTRASRCGSHSDALSTSAPDHETRADVAVVIVNYNAGAHLRRCLEALAAQTLKPRATVLVDNASTDDSLSGLEQDYPELRVIRAAHNLGFAAANNLGVREAPPTTWIATLNPDAFAAPDWLAQLLQAAHAQPDYSFFASCLVLDGDTARLDGAGDCYHRSGLVWRRRHGQPAWPAVAAGEVFAPCAAAALYRRDWFAAVGGFDEDFFCYLEDVDLAFRLRLAGQRCWYVPEAQAVHVGSAVTGYRSDFSTYYGQRNMVWTYVQNMPSALVWRSLPLFVLVNLAALLVGGRRGQLGVVARAKWDALRGLGQAWRKRRARQATRRVTARELDQVLEHGWQSLVQRSATSVQPPAFSDLTPQHRTQAPTVSLMIVNYNAGALLTAAVSAALASSVPVEVIVSDNGSHDDSLAHLRATHGADARLLILENGANLGFAAANNRALPLARAEHLLFLNPDCLLAPETLERLLPLFAAHPDVGMIGCLVCDPDGREQVACRRAIPDPWNALQRLLYLDRLYRTPSERRLDQRQQPLPTAPVVVEAISGSFMLTTRRALEQVGPLDDGYFLHCEDLDWFVRFHAAGLRILFVPDVRVIHHKGSCSTGNPLAVERHKHRGMVRFFRLHQAARHSRPFVWLVVTGIWAHFVLKAVLIGVQAWRRR